MFPIVYFTLENIYNRSHALFDHLLWSIYLPYRGHAMYSVDENIFWWIQQFITIAKINVSYGHQEVRKQQNNILTCFWVWAAYKSRSINTTWLNFIKIYTNFKQSKKCFNAVTKLVNMIFAKKQMISLGSFPT